MKRRILSVILALCLFLSIAPITMAADTSYGDLKKGDIIEFGSYPQTKEVNPKIISALNDILTDDMWVSYGYYIGTGTEYDGNMTASDYMKYADLELNGEKYRAVRFSQYRPTVTSDVSSETTSAQDNNGYELNTTYFFRYEPLTWKVLDPDEGFVISNISIDSQAFENFSYYDPDSYDSAAGQAVYNGKDCKYLANDWSKCSLREWMNKDFYNTAFTAEEQAQIGKTYLDNTNPFSQKYDCAGTFDKIFTISFYDAINSDYGFDEDGSRTDFARMRPATDYAKCQGADAADATGTLPYWWLRTTNLHGAFAFGVSPNGWIVSSGGGYYNVNRTDNAVVPAFKFNPKTPTLAKGSKIEFGSYPQSEVTDADEIARVEADSENYLWVSYKYYSGTGDSTDGKMESGDFMLYKDFYSDGEMFRAVTFTEYRPGFSGGVKEKVYSHQGKNGYDPNNVYYFKYEPLTWRVLDPDEGYVMCDNIIDSQAYQNFVIKKDDKLYNSKDCTNYVSDWSTSSLRQWLNKTFYNTAFSREEKKLIGTTFLENNSADGTWFGTDTGDKIFALSYNDAVNSAYGFNSSNDELDEARKLKGTAYSNCQGLYIDDDGIAWWWLRTPDDSDKVDLVSCYGWTAPGQGVYGTGVGIVPAFKFNPKAVDVNVVYDLDGGTWAEGYAAPISYKSNETLVLPTAENLVRAGYTFAGWEQTSAMNKTVCYTAKWTAKTYTIKFDTKGGTAVADKTLHWDDKVLDGVVPPTRDGGFEFIGWNIVSPKLSATTLNCTYGELVQDDSIDTVTLGAVWRDTEAPVIIGLENGKTYCGAQKFKVTDNDTSRSAIVMINGKTVEPDADGYYTAEPANGEFKVITVDSFANMFMVTITVNADHSYGGWKFDENEHWKECKYGDSVIEKGEHTFRWVTDKEATETETGIAHEECSVCHAKRNENTEVQKLPTKLDKLRDWFVGIFAKIIKWFVDLIGDVC